MAKDAGLPRGVIENEDGKVAVHKRVPTDIVQHPSFRGPKIIRRSSGFAAHGEPGRSRGIRWCLNEIAALEDGWDRMRRDAETEAVRLALMEADWERIERGEPNPVDQMDEEEIENFVDRAVFMIEAEDDPEQDPDLYPTAAEENTEPPDATRLAAWAARNMGYAPSPALLAILEHRLDLHLARLQPATKRDRIIAEARTAVAARRQPHPVRPLITVDGLIEAFMSDEERIKLDPSTKNNYSTTIAVLREVCGGDTPISTLTRADMRLIKRVILNIPPQAKNPAYHPEYKDLTYEDIAEEIAELIEAGETPKLLAPLAQAKYVRALGTLFEYAENEKWIDDSPARGLTPKKSDDDNSGKRPFSDAALQALFPAGWRPTDDVDWMLALGLWQGMRGAEIAQIELNDIIAPDGVLAVNIIKWTTTADGGRDRIGKKSVKNRSSVRVLPFHKQIIAYGVEDLVRARRDAGEKTLFGTKAWGKGGHYDSIRKKVDARLKDVGVKDDRHSHHSFRHNFRDALRGVADQVPQQIVLALGGWSQGESAEVDYGNGYRPMILKPFLDRISYPLTVSF
jgi:integrase